MRSVLTLVVTIGAALSSSVALAQPDPTKPYLQSITYGGTGCPQGSVGSSFASDRASYTLIFDSFVASAGAGVPVTEGRKNCQVNVNVSVPAGPARTTLLLDARGYVQVPEGVSGEASVITYEQGQVSADDDISAFAGPAARDYLGSHCVTFTTNLEAAGVVPVNYNTQVRLVGPPGVSAQMTTDSLDGTFVDVVPAGCVDLSPCDDGDGDGLCDADDACPADPDNDADGDGVCAGDDLCPGSVPDQVAYLGLYQWAETNGDGVFETRALPGHPPTHSYTMQDTGGCTCQQLASRLHIPKLLTKNGCTTITMALWSYLVQ